jgi:Na+/H+ antiporter NhaD/arsenite permease-like protein
MALQYANLQNLLYFVGLTLMFGAVAETGLLRQLYDWLTKSEGNIYFIGILSTAFAALFGNVPTLLGGVEVFHQSNVVHFAELIGTNGYFWPLFLYM